MMQYLSDIPRTIIEASAVLSALDATDDVKLPCALPVDAVEAFVTRKLVTWEPVFFRACKFYCIEGIESAVKEWVQFHGDEEGARAKVKLAIASGCDVEEVLDWWEMAETDCYRQGILFRVREQNIHKAIRKASMYGHLYVVKYLMEKCGGDVTEGNGVKSAVEYASAHGHVDIVRYLVETYNIGDRVCESAFMWASRYGHLNVVQYLVENCDIDVDEGNDYMWWPDDCYRPSVLQYLRSCAKKHKE